MSSNDKVYCLTTTIEKDNKIVADKTLKQLFDRFYIIPKDTNKCTKEQIELLESICVTPTDESVKRGNNGYIVFRGIKKKRLTEEQIKAIKDSDKSQRALAKEFKVSVGTINKVKNDKY